MSLAERIAENCPHGCIFGVRVPDDYVEDGFTKYGRECPIFNKDIQLSVSCKGSEISVRCHNKEKKCSKNAIFANACEK